MQSTGHFKPLYGVVMINLMGFLLLYLYRKPFEDKVIFIGIAVTAITCLSYYAILKKRLGDEYIFIIVSMLSSIGVIMLYRLDTALAVKQIVWLIIGFTLFFTSYYVYIKFEIWDRLIYHYAGISLMLFLLTIVLGKEIKGANNWIVIGNFSFQPSEIIKLLYVLFIASYYKNPDKLKIPDINFQDKKIEVSSRVMFSLITYCYLGFLVLQREWGSTLLLFAVYFIFLYIFDGNKKILIINAAIACFGSALGYHFLYHIKLRVDMWLNPWPDIASKGYQITQSLFAIGAGGFFGTGLGMGRPDFIPEVQTDFIFSAICEEMGIFGGIAIILMFFILIYRGFKIALKIEGAFEKNVALGITLMFGFQTFIIIGGVINLIPLTGITLPFISYGGSSLTASFISLGILQAISKKSY